MRNPVTVINE